MDILRQLNVTSAGQIALNLDKQDEAGSDGKITKSVWDSFWSAHGGDAYKGRNENIGEEGLSVQLALNLIMTRIFNAARKTGQNVNSLGQKWLNDIEGHEHIDAGTVIGTSGSSSTSGSSETGDVETGETEDVSGSENTQEEGSVTKPQGSKEGKFTTESIKVNIRPKYMSRESKEIYEGRKQGRALRESLRKGKTNGLNTKNISAAMDNSINFGPHSLKQAEVVLKLLIARMTELNIWVDGRDYGGWASVERDFVQKGNYKGLNQLLHSYNNRVRKAENEYVQNDAKEKQMFNNDIPKMRAQFDKANALLVEVANNPSLVKGRIKQGHNDKGNYNWKNTQLPDGRWIEVIYDDKGNIKEIRISHDTTLQTDTDGTKYDGSDVKYSQENADVDTNPGNSHFEHFISSGYNWNELVRIAESIFGKFNE